MEPIVRNPACGTLRLDGVAAGIVAGLAGATLLSQVASSMFFEIGPFDPVTFLAAPIVLAVVALAACYAPARRATRVDPVTTLRS